MNRLLIISHTEHYKTVNGTIVGLGSTVTEINHLLALFDHIIHIGMLHDSPAPASALAYVSNRVTFVPIPAAGGAGVREKISILNRIPILIKVIRKQLATVDYFQFRAPTAIGVFVIPYLMLNNSHLGWFKYAGNWNQRNPPLASRIQKFLLQHQRRLVTINGAWKNQPGHCISFENPCLTDLEYKTGIEIRKTKVKKEARVELCFVGRLEPEKGLDLLLEALMALDKHIMNKLKVVHVVGAGNLKYYENIVENCAINFRFYGSLARPDVHSIFKTSHAIILPSKSEGFPKVIAEAMNYGCLPIVTAFQTTRDVVIHGYNGYLIEELSLNHINSIIRVVIDLSSNDYERMILRNSELMGMFTYSFFLKKMKKILFK